MKNSFPGLDGSLAAATSITARAGDLAQIRNALHEMVHAADWWEPVDLDKPATVKDIRALQLFALQSPVGASKIAYIPQADTLRAETVNALLKLAEEPPEYLSLVLVSESGQLLPTLASRVRHLGFVSTSATIHGDGASTYELWQAAFQRFDLKDPRQADSAKTLLYLYPLVHSTIDDAIILDAFS